VDGGRGCGIFRSVGKESGVGQFASAGRLNAAVVVVVVRRVGLRVDDVVVDSTLSGIDGRQRIRREKLISAQTSSREGREPERARARSMSVTSLFWV
jgi:hypothetical protein